MKKFKFLITILAVFSIGNAFALCDESYISAEEYNGENNDGVSTNREYLTHAYDDCGGGGGSGGSGGGVSSDPVGSTNTIYCHSTSSRGISYSTRSGSTWRCIPIDSTDETIRAGCYATLQQCSDNLPVDPVDPVDPDPNKVSGLQFECTDGSIHDHSGLTSSFEQCRSNSSEFKSWKITKESADAAITETPIEIIREIPIISDTPNDGGAGETSGGTSGTTTNDSSTSASTYTTGGSGGGGSTIRDENGPVERNRDRIR